MTIPADITRLETIAAELEQIRQRTSQHIAIPFSRDDLMLEATIRIGGAASECERAARRMAWAIRNEEGES